MSPELSTKLLTDFPRLYRNRQESSMQYGFACGDGWFDLIYKLSKDIAAVARKSGLSPDSPEWPLCRQVKEKLGSLRFVVFAVDERLELYERISELRLIALNQSFQICEYCGKPGELITECCIATMCPECARRALTERTSTTTIGITQTP